jgi:hypothetical protein
MNFLGVFSSNEKLNTSRIDHTAFLSQNRSFLLNVSGMISCKLYYIAKESNFYTVRSTIQICL